jgi:membrane protein YqaA with SNARE-associated domain
MVIPGWKLLRSLGGVGLLTLGVADSSVIPTFGSLDALTAIMAAKNHELWLYYAAASTAGALIGAYITYRVSERAGEHWLEKRIGPRHSGQVQRLLERWGFAAVFGACIAPPPFPTAPFFVGAGVLHYPQARFLSAVLTGRAFRYAAIGALAAKYSETILRFLRRPLGFGTEARLIGIMLAGFAVLVAAIVLWRESRVYFQRTKAESAAD